MLSVPAKDSETRAPLERLARAVALSSQMLDAAKAGDWDLLASLESERSNLLGADFASALSEAPATAARVKESLATCLRLNDEIAALTGARMARLGELLTEMSSPPAGNGPPRQPPG